MTQPEPRDIAQMLEDLREGQRRLSADLARSRRFSICLAGLLVLGIVLGAGAWYEHVGAVPIVLPGYPGELDREELAAQVEGLTAQVRSVRIERNQHLQDSLRLRERLAESERRLSDLTIGLGEIASRKVERSKPVVSVSRTKDRQLQSHPARLVSDALAASAVTDFSIVEYGFVEAGVLHDVLMARLDARGVPTAAEHFDRAHLQMRLGVVELVFERDAGAEDDAAFNEAMPMPAADLAAWAAVGLAVEEGLVPVARASEALAAVLEGQLLELSSLGGYFEGRFHDLVLVERDGRGVISRTWTAALAELLPVGPTLVLEDGHLEEDGVQRPFWKGRTRLVLEGALYDTFLGTLRRPADAGVAGRG